MKRYFLTFASAILLAACGNSSGSGESEPSQSPAAQSTQPVDTAFLEACNESGQSEILCQCMAEQAGDLPETSRDFLLATMRGEHAEAVRMRGEMSQEESEQAGLFLVLTSAECARQDRYE